MLFGSSANPIRNRNHTAPNAPTTRRVTGLSAISARTAPKNAQNQTGQIVAAARESGRKRYAMLAPISSRPDREKATIWYRRSTPSTGADSENPLIDNRPGKPKDIGVFTLAIAPALR